VVAVSDRPSAPEAPDRPRDHLEADTDRRGDEADETNRTDTDRRDATPVDHSALSELARRRGLYFPATSGYGGAAGLYTYGPTGAPLKRRLEAAWRRRFVAAEDNLEIESPTVVPEAVFEASGHADSFADPVVACRSCERYHRADHLIEAATDLEDAEDMTRVQVEEVIATRDLDCPDCDSSLAGQPVEAFDLTFQTAIGPGDGRPAALRPETAQGTLVEFPRLAEYARERTPFGVAQVGRAYRNEISPRKTVVRLRELTLAELQTVYDPERDEPPIERVAEVPVRLYPVEAQETAADTREDPEYVETTVATAAEEVIDNPWVAYYVGVSREWLERVGVAPERLRFRQHRDDELAHYAVDCWDPEVEVDGEWIELAGVADRRDNDLANHAAATGDAYTLFREYDDPRTVERATVDPDMAYLGPRFGEHAPAVVEALEELAREDPEAFDGEVVELDAETVGLDPADSRDDPEEATVSMPVERTGFAVETVTEHGERIRPHVVEPAFGIDRVLYAVLAHSLREDVVDGETRTYLELEPAVAPTLAAVFPVSDALAERARAVADELERAGLSVAYDDSGSIGRRYRRQDEVGTPFCVTLDERTPADERATIRDRDTTAQVRVPLEDLPRVFRDLRDRATDFAALEREFEVVDDE
jgi:glycyl-tRNA synthetase